MSARFETIPTSLVGVTIIRRRKLCDNRGFLERLYCQSELSELGIDQPIRQINRTMTKAVGSIRGMHFQHAPMAECKIVSCLQGRVFDVAVDLRKNSPQFGQWFGVELAGEESQSLMIGKGFAHGFQTLEPDTEMLYLHSQDYAPEHEGGVNALDPDMAIAWPLAVEDTSTRDQFLPRLADGFEGIVL